VGGWVGGLGGWVSVVCVCVTEWVYVRPQTKRLNNCEMTNFTK
jgi:hypothetical protein